MRGKYEQQGREQLGMSFGTASQRLKKLILFDVLKRHGENLCYRCKLTVDTPEELSVEHKQPWLHAPNAIELFWSLENIAFSHFKCNARQSRNRDWK